jgi:hypothetical protein
MISFHLAANATRALSEHEWIRLREMLLPAKPEINPQPWESLATIRLKLLDGSDKIYDFYHCGAETAAFSITSNNPKQYFRGGDSHQLIQFLGLLSVQEREVNNSQDGVGAEE